MTTTKTTTGELYVRAMAATQRIIDGVAVDRWHASTPCTEWDARRVANHIIGENLWGPSCSRASRLSKLATRSTVT